MTRMIQTVFPVAAALVGCGTTASAAPQPLVIDRDVAVAEGASLSVENVSGEIRLEAWDKDTVHIHAEKTGARAEAIEVKIDADPRHLDIRTLYPRRWDWRDEGRVAYRIQVPRKRLGEIRLVNVSGDIGVSEVRSEGFRLETVSGALQAERCEGPVKATSVSGSLQLKILSGEVDAQTVSGATDLSLTPSARDWRCRLHTVSGSLALALPKETGALVTASTVSGETRLDDPKGDRTTLQNGTAALGDGSGKVRIETVSGDCRITRGE